MEINLVHEVDPDQIEKETEKMVEIDIKIIIQRIQTLHVLNFVIIHIIKIIIIIINIKWK